MNSENFIENFEEFNFKSYLLLLIVGLYKIIDIIKLFLFLLFFI